MRESPVIAPMLPMATALHGVFEVGMVICVVAVISAFLVPGGTVAEQTRGEAAMRGRVSDAR